MAEFKMINLGVYYEHLRTVITDIENKRKIEKDPYVKWNFAEQKKVAEKLLQDYDRLILKQNI